MPRFNTTILKTALLVVGGAVAIQAGAEATTACIKPVYLTFDTGHMGVADLVADVLSRQHVKVTFFAANERTQVGDGSLGEHWAPWWRARALEGHEFASHTMDHAYWRGDAGTLSAPAFRIQPSAGPRAGEEFSMTSREYCEEITQAARRLQQVTGKPPLPLFRAPGGKTSARLLSSAQHCGYAHVGWSPAGFLGDELSSERASNSVLLKRALQNIRSGDVLLAHLGIWSRKDPWAPAVLEPLIVGLKEKGFCFKTLREHPDYQNWLRNPKP
ncbi:polysaccharide deacetylase family protein [Acidovorax sp. NCPPB 4044]|uniref:polysaccharide deacetylase family protein n=1 Tax=Acidovorax sp. NCPPB 4044 TaxID=2940490 RepID=UPI002304377B|nr:polysaccharide deacetylase family protein [Acidovorax sp. NCPPB 4044]MDA8519967.1 polysaccharide deacetylase family protein [Acidovorax sp. NCPPB 4044]